LWFRASPPLVFADLSIYGLLFAELLSRFSFSGFGDADRPPPLFCEFSGASPSRGGFLKFFFCGFHGQRLFV